MVFLFHIHIVLHIITGLIQALSATTVKDNFQVKYFSNNNGINKNIRTVHHFFHFKSLKLEILLTLVLGQKIFGLPSTVCVELKLIHESYIW